jgi:NACHT domain
MIALFLRHTTTLRTVGITLGVTAIVWYFLKKVRILIVNHGKTLINGIFWILERLLTRSISAQLSMRRYCANQLSNESGRFLQVPGSRSAALDVDEVFVPLTLELGRRNKTFTSANVLDAGSRLVIVGDPGCGKSTLVKRIFRDTCWATQARPSKGRLPIRLELKGLTPPSNVTNDADAGDWIISLLRNSVSQVEGFEMSQLFDSWSAGAGLLVLLDGLDEVASEKYLVIAAGIRGLSRRLAELATNNVVVLTMRIQFHQQVRREFEEDFPQTLYVRSFLPNEIFTFLNRWPFESDNERIINRIYSELTDRPTLREMCSNPLVLAMYVENDYESGGSDAPDTRTQFYEKVVTELLIKRRRRQDVATGRSVSLRDQREEILGELALQNLLDSNQPVNSLSWSNAIAIAQRVWSCSISDAELRLRELASETGIISEERPGQSLRFIHLTFCEFLAANQCAKGRKDGWQVVLDQHRKFVKSGEPHLQTRLVEVLPFAHALLPRVDRDNALSDVASLNDRLALGRCFLETQLYGQREWRDYLHDEREYLATASEDDWNEGQIRRLHLFSVVVRDARDWYVQVARVSMGPELESVFVDIVRGNREIVAKVFATYASQDAAAAVRLAEQVGVDMLTEHPQLLVESCQEEPFLALALDGLKSKSVNSWASILIEAALLFSNVSYRLDSTPCAADTLLRKMDGRFRKLFWLGMVEKGSWYELLLWNVLQSEQADSGLSATKDLKACAGRAAPIYGIYRLRYFLATCIVVLGLIMSDVTTAGFPKHLQWYLSFPVDIPVMLAAATFYSLALDARILYKAIFNFVSLLTSEIELGRFSPPAILLRSDRIRRTLLATQSNALVSLTMQRQDEPYLRLRQWYPTKSVVEKSKFEMPEH